MLTENADTASKPVNVALQGGGAHGAFAWGVLDTLLEDGRLEIEALSATSAGAMNAAVFAYGVQQGGRDGARETLEAFWRAVSRAGAIFGPLCDMPWERCFGGTGMLHSPSFHVFDAMTRLFSPYQFNPFNFNPLRDVLAEVVDFDRLSHGDAAVRLYVSATNVRTGKIKVFENADMSVDVVMASACLPHVFQAVEIDGEHYWDGGYMGNPAIFPLIYNSVSKDVIVVHINPLVRDELPTTPPEIFNRVNEITFNSSLMREMRAIAFVTRLIDTDHLDPETFSRMLIHSIRDDDRMTGLSVASKLSPDWSFLCQLRDIGRAAARDWLALNFARVGVESTVDIAATYLEG